MSQPAIHQTLLIHAGCSTVWQLLTDASQMSRWLSDDGMIIASSFKPGEPITFSGLLHERPYEAKGMVLEFEPKKKFAYTFWTSLSEISDSPENYSTFGFTLECHGHTTVLKFTGHDFATNAIYAHHRFYWQVTLNILKQLAERGTGLK